MAVKQDVNVGLIAFVGLVGSMILLITVWGVQAWYAYEVDVLNTERYEADQNVEWIDHKLEQYANIGDPVGNDTIYADGALRDEEVLGGEGAARLAEGYRFYTDRRDLAAIPIHEAMAIVARENGHAATAEQMMDVDTRLAKIVNEAYASHGTPTEAEPQNAPSPEPQAESALGERGGRRANENLPRTTQPVTTRPAGN